MKFIIKHESKGRIRIHAVQYRMTYVQADTLLYYLHSQKEITFAKVYDRTCDATISYAGDRERIIATAPELPLREQRRYRQG